MFGRFFVDGLGAIGLNRFRFNKCGGLEKYLFYLVHSFLMLQKNQPRLAEIDFLRGLAVLAMVGFHFLFDYDFFSGGTADLYSWQSPWFWLGRLAAVLFVAIAGLSLYLRLVRRQLSGKNLTADFWRRAVFIFGLGLLITFFTYLFFRPYTVWFGVLHLIGFATLASVLVIKRPKLALALGFLVVLLGLGFSLGWFGFAPPFWIGIFPLSFSTFDYFPLLPWLGIFWMGIGIGHLFYPNAKPLLNLKFSSANPLAGALAWLGRHSLWIYFVHQFLLVGLLWVLGLVRLGTLV